MRAIRVHEFGGPDVLRLETNVPDPQAGTGQVVVRVHAVGVNPVDTYVRSGSYGRDRPLPYTPGSDAAGVVESVGEGVTDRSPGQRVYVLAMGGSSGAYAERMVCAASQAQPLPENVSFAQGAAIGVPYATAYRALLQRAGARPGETILVHGATGGVGVAAVQIARSHGMIVIGTGGTDEGRRLVQEQGAQHVLDHHDAGYRDAIKALTNGRGVDVILEMLANVNLGNDLGMLAPRGRAVVIGSRGHVEVDPRDTMARDADIRGMSLFNASADDLTSIHAALVAGLENGTLRPIVGQEFPLAEAARAHEAVMASSGAHGKIVLIP